MKRLDGIVTLQEIPGVIAEIEEIADHAPHTSVGAIYVLKNELGELEGDGAGTLGYDRIFHLPGGLWYRLRRWRRRRRKSAAAFGRELWGDLGRWLAGRDAARFRDRCDRYYYEEIVPEILANFGALADPMINTVNEAIINYAEYSFKRWALRRRVKAQIFQIEGNLGYAIVRPLGGRLKNFDPFKIKTKKMTGLRAARRGWGHTIIMGRALFVSFDHEPKRRGMLIIVGPDDPRDAGGPEPRG